MISSLALPFHGTYWVVQGRLLAGPYPGHPLYQDEMEKRVEELVNLGIRSVINLMREDEVDHEGKRFTPYMELMDRFARQRGSAVHAERHPIRDMGIPESGDMERVLDRIDALHSDGRAVYVHCWGGKGRTGMVIGCYLLRHGMATNNDVLDRLRRLRDAAGLTLPVPETAAQRAFLVNWRR